MYRVVTFDNAAYGRDDQDQTDSAGQYATAEEAIAAAQVVVDKSLRWEAKQSKSVEDLLDRYMDWGDSPGIRGEPRVTFSASEYARERAAQIFAEAIPR